MYDQSLELIEMPEHNNISVCLYIEQDGIFEFGERIEAQFEGAYMNGYGWDSLINYYVSKQDPQLASEMGRDSEAGMYVAYMSYSEENLKKMRAFEQHIKTMIADEAKLISFIAEHGDKIEWD